MKYLTFVRLYDELNQRVFANVLVRPTILNRRWRGAWGQFSSGGNSPDTMEFNMGALKGISNARATIYHEMIHQYVEDYLGLDEDNHHGDIFWSNYKKFALADISDNF